VLLKGTNAAVVATVGVYFGLAYAAGCLLLPLFFGVMFLTGGGGVGVTLLGSVIQTVISGFVYAAGGVFAIRRAQNLAQPC